MKKLITIFLLLIPFTAFSGDVATFQKHGNLKMTIASPPINQSDSKATYMVVTAIIPNDGTVKGDLYDAGDNLITRGRVYAYSGGYKNIPFNDLNDGQKGYLGGEKPADKWEVVTIKLWMSDRQVKNAEGLVSKDDPYTYGDKATKEELLGTLSLKPAVVEIVK